MVRRVRLPLTGTPGDGSLYWQWNVTPVGSGQILSDGSDATLMSYTGNGAYFGSPVAQSPSLPTTNYRVFWRLKATAMSTLPLVRLRSFGGSDLASNMGVSGAYVDGWYQEEFTTIPSPVELSEGLEGGLITIEVELRGLDSYSIYEGEVLVEVKGVAPPCRRFPREDDLGVGGGNRARGAKSQQRSGRRFGYY